MLQLHAQLPSQDSGYAYIEFLFSPVFGPYALPLVLVHCKLDDLNLQGLPACSSWCHALHCRVFVSMPWESLSGAPFAKADLFLWGCTDDKWQKEASAPQREAYEQAEIRIAIAKDDSESMTPPEMAQSLIDQILQRVEELVKKDEDLCGKKGVYMKFGCRGDWPDLQPPDENASLQGQAASSVAAPTASL